MDGYVVAVYVVCDDLLKVIGVGDDPQAIMSNAEVMAFAIIAAKLFSGHHKRARWACKQLRYFPKILSNSRLNRRIHQIPWSVWETVFQILALAFKQRADHCEYAVDSFPISCCQKNRIDRRHLFKGRQYIGWSASKHKYFCGIRAHMIVTVGRDEPVELLFRPGSESDLSALWEMELELPEGSLLYADGAYTCFDLEDILKEDEMIYLLPKRGSSVRKRIRSREYEAQISSRRQIVETAFSCITDLFPRNIRARTEMGFMLKLMSAILAYSFSFIG